MTRWVNLKALSVDGLIDHINTEHELWQLSLLTDRERDEVRVYAAHLHWDTYHNPDNAYAALGIYGCCLFPRDPRT